MLNCKSAILPVYGTVSSSLWNKEKKMLRICFLNNRLYNANKEDKQYILLIPAWQNTSPTHAKTLPRKPQAPPCNKSYDHADVLNANSWCLKKMTKFWK